MSMKRDLKVGDIIELGGITVRDRMTDEICEGWTGRYVVTAVKRSSGVMDGQHVESAPRIELTKLNDQSIGVWFYYGSVPCEKAAYRKEIEPVGAATATWTEIKLADH